MDGARRVECCARDWFPYRHFKSLSFVLEQFVGKIEHRDVELYAQHLPHPVDVVKEVGIAPVEVYRDDAPPRLYALDEERLLPFRVGYLAIDATRTQPGGEHDELLVGGKARLHHLGEIA